MMRALLWKDYRVNFWLLTLAIAFLIGPPEERWDLVMLVRHRSVETFVAFASNEAYSAGLGHRLAAISDSRLLPVVTRDVPRGA